MAVRKLSKSESKYRKKLIAEYHLYKGWQLKMDYWAFCIEYYLFCSTPYKTMYQKCKVLKSKTLDELKQLIIKDSFSNDIIKDSLKQGEYAAINFIAKNKVRDWQSEGIKNRGDCNNG